MKMPVWLTLALVLMPAAAGGQPAPLSTAQSERAARALSAWLEAEVFDPSELQPLIQYGQAVVPSLIVALDAGPSPARRERQRRLLDAEHDMLQEQARNTPGRKLPSKTDYVNHYTANFEALYRVRAAQALAAIGGAEARKALEAAAGKTGRDDVRSAIQESLKQFK